MISKSGIIYAAIFSTALAVLPDLDLSWYWAWTCIAGKCVRSPFPIPGGEMSGAALEICRLTCGSGPLWPQPSGHSVIGSEVVPFHPAKVRFDFSEMIGMFKPKEFLQEVNAIFGMKLLQECGNDCVIVPPTEVFIHFKVESSNMKLNWETDESYSLNIATIESKVIVHVKSKTVYGSRHALETLTQLITSFPPPSVTWATRHMLVMVNMASVSDRPAYAHRGLMLDTARNYISLPAIWRTLDAMAMAKFNVFHWHMTDSHSFPLEIPRVPNMARYGAYAPDKMYTMKDVEFVVNYAKLRGIRVIMEIDTPAHAGNGWQWGILMGLGQLTLCVNFQPWRLFCVQPPCGQLNPINPAVYKTLGDIYSDLIKVLPEGEAFHMGGDEVYFPCWNKSAEIISYMEGQRLQRSERDFLDLWGDFQKKAVKAFDVVNAGRTSSPIMLWSSKLTSPENIDKYLNKKRYVIETWVEASNPLPRLLLQKGYKIVIATKDKWYLDHGFWGKTVYHDWKTAYNNKLPDDDKVLGGEALMWSELVDENSLDVKIWPRAAAVAERLWTNPITMSGQAETRLQYFRERLVKSGIEADAITPTYCYQNEGLCTDPMGAVGDLLGMLGI